MAAQLSTVEQKLAVIAGRAHGVVTPATPRSRTASVSAPRARGDEFRRYTWRDVVEEPAPTVAELQSLLGG